MASVKLTLSQALDRATSAYKARKFIEAEHICREIISAKPDFFDALHLMAATQASVGKSALALASYDRALTLRPRDVEALNNRGNVLQSLTRYDEALADYDRALALRPDHAHALYNRGNALQALRRHDEAIVSYDRALLLRPDFAEALYNRGNAFKELNRQDEALASYDRALYLRPNFAEALNNRGFMLFEKRRLNEALASYDQALAVRPDYRDALSNRAAALRELKRLDEALASYDRALGLWPDDADALNNRGSTLRAMRRYEEALASYGRALAAKPDHAYALSGAADCAIKLCDWHRRSIFTADVVAHAAGRKSIVSPFLLLAYSGDPALQLLCAQSFVKDSVPVVSEPIWRGLIARRDKIRIAYLSPDFRDHPVSYLSAELFELHDRKRFEVIGLSLGRDDRSEIRARIAKAFDVFHDIRSNSDRDAARFVNNLEIDIAVDMSGYTEDNRMRIFAHRPAPIQASYLGFPATMGAEFIDYIIADKVVAPFEEQKFYTEKIVHLPECFQVNDRKRAIAGRTPTKVEAGLPEHGFVFCCFNNNWKITPEMFDIWMRLLERVEGSVLWLSKTNELAMRNLCREAQARGIDRLRLIFAPRLTRLEEHLARHRLADLFLDTLPYNAHATTSDALWAGLPLLTCKGGAFAGRVAASLLDAIGLPELITSNLQEYEALALKLALTPALLSGIKAKLLRHRESYPLFDTPRFARHLESAYTTMWEIWQRGETPRGFSVEPTE